MTGPYSVPAPAAGADATRFFRRVAAVATLIAACLITGAPTAAQVRAGGHVVYRTELIQGTTGYGGRVEIDLGFLFEQLTLIGIYDRLSPNCNQCEFWQTSGQLGLVGAVGWIGLGVGFSRLDDPEAVLEQVTDEWTFEVSGGARYRFKGFLTPFFEIRNELGDGVLNNQTLSLGVLVGPYLGSSGGRRNSARGTR